jgi:hypothetical protein
MYGQSNSNFMPRALDVCLVTLVIFNSCSPVSALPAFFSDDQQLSLPSSGPDIRNDRIRSLTISDGARADIFTLPIRFPHLNSVGLATCDSNASHLKQLSTNYPRLNLLSIRQKSVFDDESLRQLAHFHHLVDLRLDCPIATATVLAQALPSLKGLLIGPNSNMTTQSLKVRIEFPDLLKLEICGTSIEPSFFIYFEAPRLKRLELVNVTLKPGSLEFIENLPNLKVIDLHRTAISPADIVFLERHHIHVTRSSG